MPYYDYPTNISSIEGIMIYNNAVTGDIFGMALLIAVFMVAFLSMKRYPTEKAFCAASFITAITSYLFAAIPIVSGYVILIPTLMFVISLFMVSRDRGGY